MLAAMTVACPFSAQAAVDTWDGGGGGTSWSFPDNWLDDTSPTALDDVLLDNSAFFLPSLLTLDADFTIRSLVFGDSPSANRLPLTLDAGVVDSTLTINGTAPGAALISVNGGPADGVGAYLRIEGVNSSYTSTATGSGTSLIPTRLNVVLGAGVLNVTPGSNLSINANIGGTAGWSWQGEER